METKEIRSEERKQYSSEEISAKGSVSSPGKRLERLCEIEGMSRSELARRLNVAPSQISRILNGETKTISSDILIRAAREFQVTTDYLLGLESESVNGEAVRKEQSGAGSEERSIHIPMLLMSTAFRPGQCLAMIEQLEDADVKKMAYCEYYYFNGQHDKAVDLTELYLNHSDPMLRLSACLIHTFANLSLNRMVEATGRICVAKRWRGCVQVSQRCDSYRTDAAVWCV